MKSILLLILIHCMLTVAGQGTIDFVSDTQAPMRIEKLRLRGNQNTLATKLIFNDIAHERPNALFILGDVVSLGRKEKRWREMDTYLDSLLKNKISYYGILGNHDVMGNARKGMLQFNKRFPAQVNTGYVIMKDSIAVVLLNSNFKALPSKELLVQKAFYAQTLKDLDENPGVKFVIVTCHHAPYTNSSIVGSSAAVQREFVPLFEKSTKAKLFITGHAHAFELFKLHEKYFITIGGGGGLHQPFRQKKGGLVSISTGYNPEFHYLSVMRKGNTLEVISRRLTDDFKGFVKGYEFGVK